MSQGLQTEDDIYYTFYLSNFLCVCMCIYVYVCMLGGDSVELPAVFLAQQPAALGDRPGAKYLRLVHFQDKSAGFRIARGDRLNDMPGCR